MKVIILIQSIIILLGAYYIYTLSKAEVVIETTPVEQIVVPKPIRAGYVEPTEQPPRDVSELDASSTIKGPNDSGMEYPIMDVQ